MHKSIVLLHPMYCLHTNVLIPGTWHSLIHQKYIYLFFICHNLISLLPIKAVPLSSLSVVSFSLLTDLCDSYWRALVVYQTYLPCLLFHLLIQSVSTVHVIIFFILYVFFFISNVSLCSLLFSSLPFLIYIGYFSVGEPFFDILFHYSYVSLSTCIYQSFLLIGYFFLYQHSVSKINLREKLLKDPLRKVK